MSRPPRLAAVQRSWFRSQLHSTTRRKVRRFQPVVEYLEERAVPSATPVHLYELNGSLADQLGGPALVANGGTLTPDRYAFSSNQGLQLSGALASTSTYSVVLVAELDLAASFYKKLIDFQNRTDDDGLYLAGAQLQLFPGGMGPDSLVNHQDFHLVLTRDSVSGLTQLYLNGALQQTYSGGASSAAVPLTNVLTFFADDNTTGGAEATSGSVDYIAIYDHALTSAEIAELIAPPISVTPSVSANLTTVSVNEGQTATNTGSWDNAISLVSSAGVVVQNPGGTWSWSFAASNGPAQTQDVTITATSGDGSTAQTTFHLVVHNLAPIIGTGSGPAVSPAHLYELNGSLADQLGGPALVADGGTLTADRYVFNANQGLRLSGALASTSHYSLVVVAELDSLANFYNKLIDFQNRSVDEGLYAAGGTLQLFPGAGGFDSLNPNQDFQLALTRDGSTGLTQVYLNGVLQQTYSGMASSAAVPLGNILTFFEDDSTTGGTEAVGGSVDSIAIYDRPLTAAEVTSLLHPSSGSLLVEVTEGETATNTGMWCDPGSDTVTLSASVGVVTQHPDGTWSWSFATGDGPGQSQMVTITATDSDDATSTTTFALVVHNLPPSITSLSSSNPTFESRSSDGLVTLTGSLADAGVLDTHVVTVAWGDGSAVETLVDVDQVNDLFTGTHHYTQGGIFTITVTVTDNDGAQASQTTTAVVTGIGLVDGTLYVIGSEGRDDIALDVVKLRESRNAPRETFLRITTRSGAECAQDREERKFPLTQVENIVILAGGGNDQVRISREVTLRALVLGGAGDDNLQAGGGPTVLVGGGGKDHLQGGPGGDLLIGGEGRDWLAGRKGDDLLLGGSAAQEENLAALALALQEWHNDNLAGALSLLEPISPNPERDWLRGNRGDDIFYRE